MIVEDKILEYLDGSLSDRESAELLETLSVSPEKRALLEEHLRLKDLLTLGRKPYSVPTETERSLAERIPVLAKYSDDLVPARWPFLRRWVGARTIGLAVGAGAMMILAGLGWYSLRGTNTQGAARQPAPLARAVSSPGRAGAATQEFSSSGADLSAPISALGDHAFRVYKHQAISNPGAASGMRMSDRSQPAAPVAQPDIIGQENATAPIAPVAPLASAAAIPTGGWFPHTLAEIELPMPKDLGPVTVGGSMILNESYLPTVSTSPSHSLTLLTGDATVDYDLSPSFAVGIDIGTGIGSTLSNSSYRIKPSSYYTRLFENPVVSNQALYDLLLTAHLTLFPESEYQFRLGIAGGSAFGAGPMAQATAGISRVLAPNLTLDLTAVGSRVWMKNSAPLVRTSTNGVVGIVGQQISPQTLFTTALGVQAGLRVRL